MTYDPNNVFAKILRGELPCHKVHEDEHTLALMDIMPRGDGHTLVIPKNPARNLLDVAEADLSNTIIAVQRIARAAKTAMKADGVTIQHSTRRGRPGGLPPSLPHHPALGRSGSTAHTGEDGAEREAAGAGQR
jgi:histidine triad (HIT) family protein